MPRQKPRKRRQAAAPKKILIFSWPAVVFVLLLIGVLLVGWTFLAVADDIDVSAKVSAPLPTGPATITAPSDGQHFSAVPITVTGTCPADGSGAYIKLFRNNVFSGTALCDGSQNFSLSTDLFPGGNKLKAVIFNKTDDAGPDSNAPVVYYDVPQNPPTQNPPQYPPSVPPFVITTDFKYSGFYVGQNIRWTLSVSGGSAPYALNIDWGDGKNSVVSRSGQGEFTVEHKYDKPGGFKGSYRISISGADAVGRQTSLEIFALVNQAGGTPIAGTTYNPPPLSSTKNWLIVAWPAYLVVLLMTISYLLGEREELKVLKKRGLLRVSRA